MTASSGYVAAIGAAVGLVGTMLGGAWAESCPTQCASGKVPLGLAVPMSGPIAVFGQQTAKAVEMAVRELNATGGLMGIPVELAIGDDRCEGGLAASVATRHIKQDKINFVIGPICPDVAIDAAPIYAKAGVVQLVPTVTIMELTGQNSGTIFRIAATDEQEAQALGVYLAREQSSKKLTVVYTDNNYRRAMAEMVRLALPPEMKESARFEPLMDVSGAADRLADKLQRDPRDFIYMALDAAPAVELVGKLRTRGMKSIVMGGQHQLSQVFWRAQGPAATDVQVLAPIESLSRPEFRNAVDQLKHAGVVPDIVALYSYVSVQVWAQAVRRAGGGDPKKVAEVLRSGEFQTALGRIAFDQKGDRREVSYSIVTRQAGSLTELRMVQQGAVTPPPAPVPAASKTATAAAEDILRFEEPIPFGPFPVNGNTIKQLADSVPLFPPIEGQSDTLWKKNCSNCHKWDRQTLCQQGASYVANPQNVLRQQHPFGGPFKVALMRWSKNGCQ